MIGIPNRESKYLIKMISKLEKARNLSGVGIWDWY